MILTDFIGKQHFSKVVSPLRQLFLSLTYFFIALERYQPEIVGSKSDSILGRFPMRNRFISDYIFETTGKRRTPKQVGSRLQQLRDTCKKDKSEMPTHPSLLAELAVTLYVFQSFNFFPIGIFAILVQVLSRSAVSALQSRHLLHLTVAILSR